MIEVIKSETFRCWLLGLKDRRAAMRIQARIDRAEDGNLGDHKHIREGIWEMRIDYGPGYRVYFLREGAALIVLLAGGDKTTQAHGIKKAIELAQAWR